ncbi:MAG: S1 RNA-binding domain-containing protein [Planctomycetes bacterium]|nr:S1 RNA-binding domain-containing protein [Planctomycetota bacterium]
MTSKNDREPDLSREIDAALDGMNLQELDLPERGGGPKRRGQDGQVIRGAVAGVSGKDVIVELGPRMQGVLPLSEFDAPPKVGEVFEFTLHGREDDLWKLSRKKAQELAAAADVEPGALVKARVTGQNTGGLELRIGNLPAFMPASQVGLTRENDLAKFLNQTLVCEVLEVDPAKRRVVVSRRAVLEKERAEQTKESLGRISVGQKVQGKVTRVEPFGAFVDLGGGLEGLVHVSNISHKRVENASEALQSGQQVEVQVIKIEEGGKRIGLSMKALEPDPWQQVGGRVAPDSMFQGTVKRLMEFGAFVELEPGIEGLLHVSQMAKDRVRRAADLFKVGDKVQVRVIAVEPDRQRISLSRMDARGALLGSDDSVDGTVIDQALRQNSGQPLKTNLGNLFKRAMKPPQA